MGNGEGGGDVRYEITELLIDILFEALMDPPPERVHQSSQPS